ncbi:Predicted arabinose efflux permease, MFS family [Halogranum rubrum]|uniref:Predicted arabinose efflux permease, MFS family n=1 Tax=Halogranum rubrum TaxID=553466 RepID=A0A1I4D6X6_9EURY|nr:MFS transporter [Halogranum rubrum]SFK89272.1 Predicted arabinose efflux permease, MFS family [Halogranum rubrum]
MSAGAHVDRRGTETVPWQAVASLGTGLFGLGLAVGAYGAVVPLLIESGVSPDAAGFGMTVYLFGQLLAVLPADYLARTWPVHRVAAGGFVLGALGTALGATLTLSAVYLSRLLLGLGMGVAFVACMTYGGLRTSGSATATTQGALGALFTLGLAAGVALGPDAVELAGPAGPVAVAVVLALVGGAVTLRIRPVGDRPLLSLGRYLAPFRSATGMTLGLGNMAAFGFLIVATTWYSDVLAGVQGAPTLAVLTGFSLATVFGRVGGGLLAGRLGESTAAFCSLVVLAVTLAGVTVGLVTGGRTLLLASLVATGAGFGLPFGPLFSLAFANLGDEPGVTLVGMTAVGNAGALAYPWLVGRLLSETASYVPGFAVMTVTVVGVAVLWSVSLGVR